MPVETAIEQTEVASINIDERSLAFQGGQVERQALDLGDPNAKVLRCSISSSLDGRTGVSVGGITGNTYHHEPVPVVVVIVRGTRGTGHCRSHEVTSREKVKLVGNSRRTASSRRLLCGCVAGRIGANGQSIAGVGGWTLRPNDRAMRTKSRSADVINSGAPTC
jgi:hypothetical protein